MLLLVVFWVCADIEPTAKPKKTVMAPRISSFFIKNIGLRLSQLRADKEESLPTVGADVETDPVTAKVACFYKLCRSLRSGQDNPLGNS